MALDRLEAEHDNLRGSARSGHSLMTTQCSQDYDSSKHWGLFWYRHGHASDGRSWLLRCARGDLR